MGDTTKISWSESTFSGWIGCSHAVHADDDGKLRTNPLCLKCYAERDNKHWKWNGGTWGPGAPRKLTSIENWQKPFKWNKQAASAGVRRKVFAFSLADVFDEEGPMWPLERPLPMFDGRRRLVGVVEQGVFVVQEDSVKARDVLFHEVIRRTPNLDWQVLTKRFEVAAEFYDRLWGSSPWPNVWQIFSAGVQQDLDLAMRSMQTIHAVVRGISAEPMLAALDFRSHLDSLSWIIGGGESGPHARPTHPQWARVVRDQCRAAGVAFFWKQNGEWLAKSQIPYLPIEVQEKIKRMKPAWGALDLDGTWWPGTTPWNGHDDCLRTGSLCDSSSCTGEAVMFRVGRDLSGDLLDGVQYQEFPVPAI